MSARCRVGLAAGWGAVIGWLPITIKYITMVSSPYGADFGMYYAAAETLRFSPHRNIFLQQTLTETVLVHGGCGGPPHYPYPYQPLLGLLFEPLTYLRCWDASTLWLILNYTLWFGVAGFYAYQAWRRRQSLQALGSAMITVFFLPVLLGIGWGQVHLVLLVCIIAGILLVERDHDYAAGIVLGAGAVLKYFPAFLIAYYLLRGRWRVALGAAATSALLVIGEGLVVGPQTLIESISAGENDVRYYARTVEGGHWMSSLPGGVTVAYLAAVIFFVVVVWLQWRPESRAASMRLGAGWALATMLMISPLIWWYYLTWLLPALVICLEATVQFAKRTAPGGWRSFVIRWWPFMTLALDYCLLLVPFSMSVPTYRFAAAGTLLLWLLCGALYVRSAGARLPGGLASLRSWRRSPVGVAPSGTAGSGAVSG